MLYFSVVPSISLPLVPTPWRTHLSPGGRVRSFHFFSPADPVSCLPLSCVPVSSSFFSPLEEKAGLCIYNLGTGHGYSVLDIVKNFEEANDIKIPYSIKPRRPGDIATCYCDPTKAKEELGWEAQFGIKEMCADSWRWQKNNPNGYEG